MQRYSFPDGFLWGAATSAHQVEGGNVNDWTEWEEQNALRLAGEAERRYRDAVPNWPRVRAEAQNPDNYRSGRAADHYKRFREDFDIAKQLGHNAHRLSLEWSRIEPEPGVFDEAAIGHYREVLRALHERRITPFVTLWHWTNPRWIGSDGWERPATVARFREYAERMIGEYGSLIKFWMPLNEPGTYVGMAYLQGLFPPQRTRPLAANRVFRNLMQAYREAYSAVKARDPRAQVGLSHYAAYMEPYRNRWYNRIAVRALDYIRNWRFLDSVDATNDFIGIQYYHHDIINVKLGRGRWGPIEVRNENQWVSDMGWEIYPEGIYHLIRRAARYGKPIYVTENGTADAGDTHRARFIREHLSWLARAVAEGADVRGYFYWSLLDNFEWDKGFWPRFGLVGVDYQTLERRIRPSAWEYKKIIVANAMDI